MAAISTTLISLLSKDDVLVAMKDIYGGTASLLSRTLPHMGIDVQWLELAEDGSLRGDVKGANVMFLESPTNPVLRLLDVRSAVRMASEVGAITVMDNTFATPIDQRPIGMGVDVVVHSATKYLNGHSDLVGGAAVGRHELIERIAEGWRMLGGVTDPRAAYLLNHGMMTIDVRMRRHNANALDVARFLEGHPHVSRVHYLRLGSHPQHVLAEETMDGHGGVLSFMVEGGRVAAESLMRSLQMVTVTPSLGGVESLVSMPLSTSHHAPTREERGGIGTPDGMIRFSIGIEPVEGIIEDLRRALGD